MLCFERYSLIETTDGLRWFTLLVWPASECVPLEAGARQVLVPAGLGVDYREAEKLSGDGAVGGGPVVRDARLLRSRPAIDNAILIVVMLCFAIAVVRVALVAATVPYVAYLNQRQTEEAKASGTAAPVTSLAERVAHSGPFVSWWSDRRIPYPEGGDYLGVLSHHSAARTLGGAIGVLVERGRQDGTVIERVIVPSDRGALYGEESGTLMTRADGTEFRNRWGPPAHVAARFSDVPLVERDYDPVLTTAQAARLEAQAGLVERANAVYMGAPVAGSSGTWILYVREGKRREFLLVPIELSPAGDGQ